MKAYRWKKRRSGRIKRGPRGAPKHEDNGSAYSHRYDAVHNESTTGVPLRRPPIARYGQHTIRLFVSTSRPGSIFSGAAQYKVNGIPIRRFKM